MSQDEILKNLLLGVHEQQCDARKCCRGSRVRSAPQLPVTQSKYDGIGNQCPPLHYWPRCAAAEPRGLQTPTQRLRGLNGAHSACALLYGRIGHSHGFAPHRPGPWLPQKPGRDTAPGSEPPRRPASCTEHARHRQTRAPVGGKRRTPGRPRRSLHRGHAPAEAARPQ